LGYPALLSLAACLAVGPLLVWGPSCGHDFEFHLRNWLEVGSQWRQGVVAPHWAFTAAWNSGEPRFVFYPPLSWVIGAALGLVLPWAAVPTVFIGLALMASGWTMYALASRWTTEGNALIAACVYMVNPYMLFTMYERAAYAELLAAAWIPLLLLGVLRRRVTFAGVAIPVCLLWLTNAPAAVMGSYSLAVLGLIRVVSAYRRGEGDARWMREAATISAGAVLGIGMAAFYVVPATVEQRWIKMMMPFVRGVRYKDNFAFQRIGVASHDAILRTASLCGMTLLVLSAVFGLVALRAGRSGGEVSSVEGSMRNRMVMGPIAVLTCVVGFLLTAPSAFLWRHLPELKYLQFPWRFCAILGATMASFAALALRRSRVRAAAGAAVALLVTAALTMCGNHLFRQPYFPELGAPAIAQSFYHGGTYDPTDEYPPVGADARVLGHANPMFWVAAHATDAAPQTGEGYSISLAKRLHFQVSSAEGGFAVLNLRDYRAWRVSVDGRTVADRPHRADGLIAVPIPSGVSTVDVAYGRTPDQTAGWVISVVSVGVLVLLGWRFDRRGEGGVSADGLSARGV
jgi:hypothetical protein